MPDPVPSYWLWLTILHQAGQEILKQTHRLHTSSLLLYDDDDDDAIKASQERKINPKQSRRAVRTAP